MGAQGVANFLVMSFEPEERREIEVEAPAGARAGAAGDIEGVGATGRG